MTSPRRRCPPARCSHRYFRRHAKQCGTRLKTWSWPGVTRWVWQVWGSVAGADLCGKGHPCIPFILRAFRLAPLPQSDCHTHHRSDCAAATMCCVQCCSSIQNTRPKRTHLHPSLPTFQPRIFFLPLCPQAKRFMWMELPLTGVEWLLAHPGLKVGLCRSRYL